jgi:hypothetical protein
MYVCSTHTGNVLPSYQAFPPPLMSIGDENGNIMELMTRMEASSTLTKANPSRASAASSYIATGTLYHSPCWSNIDGFPLPLLTMVPDKIHSIGSSFSHKLAHAATKNMYQYLSRYDTIHSPSYLNAPERAVYPARTYRHTQSVSKVFFYDKPCHRRPAKGLMGDALVSLPRTISIMIWLVHLRLMLYLTNIIQNQTKNCYPYIYKEWLRMSVRCTKGNNSLPRRKRDQKRNNNTSTTQSRTT